ncbi:TraR/DksA C4-type zinc finger protein [Acidocella sp. MX-AZ02]|uniref:TraR/DksA family transcriptional regulator n=1 Tax=Acidocella sp. MX-AZ02 TaxID=1214225 RepID=UPI00028F1160|nr:TraR/DksA C4-type zinc finger protein [Acidocella sp. MX-AZ02]EKM98018.1 transcriptional regulator TraR/DksA family protein [Acidocella sp. MX-AZ02]
MAVDFEIFRQLLLQKKIDLQRLSEVNKEARNPVELDQTSVGRLSRMDAIQVQAMALAHQRQRETEIIAIDGALRRIEGGNYGICIKCGEEIAEARLRITPTATTCIDCAK